MCSRSRKSVNQCIDVLYALKIIFTCIVYVRLLFFKIKQNELVQLKIIMYFESVKKYQNIFILNINVLYQRKLQTLCLKNLLVLCTSCGFNLFVNFRDIPLLENNRVGPTRNVLNQCIIHNDHRDHCKKMFYFENDTTFYTLRSKHSIYVSHNHNQ